MIHVVILRTFCIKKSVFYSFFYNLLRCCDKSNQTIKWAWMRRQSSRERRKKPPLAGLESETLLRSESTEIQSIKQFGKWVEKYLGSSRTSSRSLAAHGWEQARGASMVSPTLTSGRRSAVRADLLHGWALYDGTKAESSKQQMLAPTCSRHLRFCRRSSKYTAVLIWVRTSKN